MTLLFVVEHYYPYKGGVEKLFQSLAESISNQHTIIVYTSRFQKDLPKQETINGVAIHRANLPNRYFFSFFGWYGLLKYARKADLIHTTSYNAALPAYIAARLTGKKAIITFHEYWGRLWFQLPFLRWPERILFYLYEQMILRLPFNRFVAVSDFTAQRLRASGKKQVSMIYNGLDYDGFEPGGQRINTGPFTFIYYGRLGAAKGLDLLIPAFAVVKKDNPSVRLQLIIPVIPRTFYKKVLHLVESAGITDDVTIKNDLGRTHLLNEIKAADAVVIPSYSEGFCFVAVESAALGVPVIHSGKGALAETVSGKFVQMPSFSKDGLVQAMKSAINGNWKQRPEKRFELTDSVAAYQQLYERYGKVKTGNK